jgi:hypothetical protein
MNAIFQFDVFIKNKNWDEIEKWYHINAPWLTEKTIDSIINDLRLEVLAFEEFMRDKEECKTDC